MSLGYIYLCCDDGEIYRCDLVRGDIWMVCIEEFSADELWIAAGPRPKGQPRNIPRAVVSPEELAAKHKLPIAAARFTGHRTQRETGRDYAIYSVEWWSGKAFPRNLLPADAVPSRRYEKGNAIYACYTKEHGRKTRATA